MAKVEDEMRKKNGLDTEDLVERYANGKQNELLHWCALVHVEQEQTRLSK